MRSHRKGLRGRLAQWRGHARWATGDWVELRLEPREINVVQVTDHVGDEREVRHVQLQIVSGEILVEAEIPNVDELLADVTAARAWLCENSGP